MPVITPQTDVYLVKVPLEIDDKNQLTFNNATAQFNYFNSLPKIAVDNFTYQRKDGTIRFGTNFDEIIQYNYVIYRNEAYSNKWFYAYISGMEYLNDNVTAISIETDAFQTWQFDLNYKQTFVEREHVNDDTAGIHTVPEGFDLGEFEIVDLRNSPIYESGTTKQDWIPCFCVTKFPTDTNNLNDNGEVQGSELYIGGVFSSLHFFATYNMESAKRIIKIYEEDDDVTTDAIVNIYMIPRCCINELTTGVTTVHTYTMYGVKNFYTSEEFQLQQPAVLAENYKPKNNKLLSYPYSYFFVSNNAGEDVIYHYEDFPFKTIGSYTRRTMTYQKSIVASTSLSAKLYFTNYKGYSDSSEYGTKMYNYGISYAKVPVCAWTTDYYTNWLTQNGINVTAGVAVGLGQSALSIGAGLATANPVATIAGGISLASTIANTLSEVHKAESTPPQAHGDVNTGDFGFCFKRNSISFYEMSIRPEVARIIDEYFTMFGYKVNRVKVPNITGRRNWNFVKTVGCYIKADIPQGDLQTIKDMFDRGVTFWHNPTTFADYSQNNDII